MENKTTVKGGIGFIGLLQITFIVLKLVGVIKWSWLWVLSPMWISISLGILITVLVIFVINRLNK